MLLTEKGAGDDTGGLMDPERGPTGNETAAQTVPQPLQLFVHLLRIDGGPRFRAHTDVWRHF